MRRSETRPEFSRWTWIDVVQVSLNFSVYLAGYDLSAKRQYRPRHWRRHRRTRMLELTHLMQVSSEKSISGCKDAS